MGLWDTLKTHAGAQFLDVVEWLEDDKNTVVFRFPVFNQALTDKSKLIVREGQAAVFVSEGKLSDVFGPGTYTLDTRNKPILSFFQSIAYQLQYPYKGDIYFVSTRQFLDQKWGTPNPIILRDAEFGMVRVRGFGIFAFRITDPGVFLKQVVGSLGLFTTNEINGQLKKKLQGALADTIGESKVPVLDLAARYLDLGDTLRDRMNPSFQESYGITLTDFTIENLSLPEEVEKALDTRTKMGVLGDLNAYTQLQAAEAIPIAAKNQGLGGAGIGMGVGFGMGNMMGGAMAGAMAPPPPPESRLHYHGPTGQAQLSVAEVAQRVQADRSGKHLVWRPGMASWVNWDQLPELAAAVPPAPPPPPAEEVFHYHGPSGQDKKTLSEVVALVKADPNGKHHVWQSGWSSWKPAVDVPAIQQALAAAAPPPPPGDGPPPPPL